MDKFQGLKIGMQSFTLRGFDMPGAIERIAQLGLKHVEFGKKHLSPENDGQRAQAIALCAKHGITISACGVAPFGRDESANRMWFEHARKLDAEVISGNPQPDCLDALDSLTDQFKIKVAIHNHGPGSLWPDIETIEKGLKGRSPRIGLCVDTGHFLRVPVDPVEVLRHFKDCVHAIHLKDMDVDKDGKHGKEFIVGEGPLDLKAVLKALLEWRFAGPISIEYEVHPENPMEDLKITLANIEKCLTSIKTP